MATTTNFGWETPDDTDLVKDGAAAIRTLGNSIDTSFLDLKGGTTGQILAKASNSNLDYTWINNDQGDITEVAAGTGISGGGTSGAVTITNSMATAIDAKGDLIAGTGADAFSRLAVGTNGQVLKANSSTSTGLEWGNAGSSFSGVRLFNSTDPSITNNTLTALTFDSESYDTDGFHSTSSNTSRITIPAGKAGKYFINAKIEFYSNNTGYRSIHIYKNGSIASQKNVATQNLAFDDDNSVTLDLAENDYIELYTYQNSGGALNLYSGSAYTYLEATYLGA
jgi:hypothetical protein